MLTKALLMTGGVLWLLQQTVPASPLPAELRVANPPASLVAQAPAAQPQLANPVPGGTVLEVPADEPVVQGETQDNWLVGATQAWLERTAPRHELPLSAHDPSFDGGAAATADGKETEERLREHIDVLARKVGEMEARLTQIDALGERLADIAGVEPEAFDFRHVPGQGGLLVEPSSLSVAELDREIDTLRDRLYDRGDYLDVLEARLRSEMAERARTPSAMPIRGYAYNSSSYGPRVDPITGRRAFHEGLDFAAPRGTPIVAAAGGVVVSARYQTGYGRMVEIDHGNKLVTRYAHAQQLLVKPGDLVYRGQRIATVGSTGRSTGPHLHFEVRVAGQAADPRLFLAGEVSAERLAELSTR
ncbi:M23 family metallopeptidase [Verticiella sediminum]